MDGHKFFLLYRVKLAMVCHMYRFCVSIRKGRQERYGKILFLLCEANVSKDYNLFPVITVASKKQWYKMKSYAKLCIRKLLHCYVRYAK